MSCSESAVGLDGGLPDAGAPDSGASVADGGPPDLGEPICGCEVGATSIVCGSGACVGGAGYRCTAEGQTVSDDRFCPLCSNTCVHANDGECDDGAPGSDSSGCALGTDCGDCGDRWLGDAPGEKTCPAAEITTDEALRGYAGCTKIEGWLTLKGSVSDLSPLAEVKLIDQRLRFETTDRLSVAELPALDSVGGLEVSFTTGLKELHLPNLTEITNNGGCPDKCGGLRLDNSSLEVFDLPKVGHLGINFYVDGNAALRELGPFQAARSVGFWHVANNPRLAKITGLPALEHAVELITVKNAITELSGFGALSTVGGDVEITGNAKLVRVAGFGALRTVEGHLWIRENAALEAIDGFDVIKRVEGGFSCWGDKLPMAVCDAIDARIVP